MQKVRNWLFSLRAAARIGTEGSEGSGGRQLPRVVQKETYPVLSCLKKLIPESQRWVRAFYQSKKHRGNGCSHSHLTLLRVVQLILFPLLFVSLYCVS